MTPSQPSGEESFPLSALGRLDEACDRFEIALRAGERPRIEDYLAEASDAERDILRQTIELRNRVRPLPAKAGAINMPWFGDRLRSLPPSPCSLALRASVPGPVSLSWRE